MRQVNLVEFFHFWVRGFFRNRISSNYYRIRGENDLNVLIRENAKVLAFTEVNVKATHSPRVLYWCSHGCVCVWVPSPGQMSCRGAIFQE